jgi:hypothetical protein
MVEILNRKFGGAISSYKNVPGVPGPDRKERQKTEPGNLNHQWELLRSVSSP